MRNRTRSPILPPGVLLVAGLLVAVLLAVAALAGDGDPDRKVRRRVAAMFAAQAALEHLGDMSGGRRQFDASLARAARRDLIALTHDIPALFRDPRMDPQSLALPTIWSQWDSFKAQARQAERAARALGAGSLNRLRMGLPDLLTACLDCHRRFRKPR